MRPYSPQKAGFTLIEMSIVLVIIGLLVGGVLVGQDLIRAAGARSQVSQIEKYNSAVNTFREKTGFLPGDINAAAAAQFGFVSRGIYRGLGDGNGVIEGNNQTTNSTYAGGDVQNAGETVLFWVDLSTAGLIDGGFNTGSASVIPALITSNSSPSLSAFFPSAKIGGGNYVYVYSGGYWTGSTWNSNGVNYFGLNAIANVNSEMYSTTALSALQAYSIDQKIDDGLPQSGNVMAWYLNQYVCGNSGSCWASGNGVGANGGGTPPAPTTNATAGSPTTCYDNSSTSNGTPGVTGATQHYSIEIANGSYTNCALSFKMQAGD